VLFRSPKLLSFRLSRPKEFRFTPGQFARLGVAKADADTPTGDRIAWRAYSVVSARDEAHLEFFSVLVPDGEFTSELARLQVGDAMFVEKASYGFMVCDRFEPGPDLWLLATGTGLGPFISILQDQKTWQEFDNLIVVHSVREPAELAYRETLEAQARQATFADRARLRYVPVVTRPADISGLKQRIPTLIDSGALERDVGLPLNRERSRVMICGNPDMVSDTRKCLAARGLATPRRGAPGQLLVENYW
jgi:ferredoxin--NADP+ reductase